MGKNGGKRPGAGRPVGAVNKDRKYFVDLIHQVAPTEELIEKLKELTLGVTIAKPDGEGGIKIYDKPPDAHAISYLLDQAYGKAKQSVDLNANVRTIEDELEDLPE